MTVAKLEKIVQANMQAYERQMDFQLARVDRLVMQAAHTADSIKKLQTAVLDSKHAVGTYLTEGGHVHHRAYP